MYLFDVSEIISCSMFGRMKQSNGWETKTPRAIRENLFIFMIDGSARFYIDGCYYEISAGDILIIPAQTVYQAITETTCEYFFFHFSGKIQKCDKPHSISNMNHKFSFHLSECIHDQIFFDLKIRDDSVFNKIYASIISCIEYNSSMSHTERLLMDTEFLKIMLLVGTVAEKSTSQLPATLKKMIVYIKKNLTNSISLSDVCAFCSVSAPYAARLFKQNLNMTASEYINSEKLYFACELIQNTSMNISEISDYLGYSDVFYFSKLFKKKFGKAPTKYF